MCMGCWAELGAPFILNERTLAASKAIAAVYAESCVGGHLHVIIDDWNIEDGHFDYVEAALAAFPAVAKGDEPWTTAEIECGRQLLSLSILERASALAIHDKFDPEEGREYAAAIEKERAEEASQDASTLSH